LEDNVGGNGGRARLLVETAEPPYSKEDFHMKIIAHWW
jgi:hypothetical protein